MKENKKYTKIFLIIVTAILLNILISRFVNSPIGNYFIIKYTIVSEKNDLYKIFYSKDGKFSEEKSIGVDYTGQGNNQIMEFSIPIEANEIRVDMGTNSECINISNVSINYLWIHKDIRNELIKKNNVLNNIETIQQKQNSIEIINNGADPFIVINLSEIKAKNLLQVHKIINLTFKIILCIIINLLLLLCLKLYNSIKVLIKELYNNRRLIFSLAKNDFKTKYAGSYLGIFWAFVQPVITVLTYWFVFQVGFRSGSIDNCPFLLWLIVGLVPWFFFSEAIINATNSMIEYSYLVKKVVFKISILPIVKIVSALFIHIFFIAFTIVLFIIYGYIPTIHVVQVLYYSLCTIMLVLGISYSTSAIIVFFKDLGQIVAIVLQIGVWFTPIMWSYNMVPNRYRWILKLNPMYYIVEGYRDSFINHVWVWERYNQTIYFWIVAIILFSIGTMIFRKLKVHFADVL